MKRYKWLPLIALMFCTSAALAQNMQTNPNDNRELLRMGLYPPDVIMRQQERLGITKDQRKKIAAMVREFQGEITELQWNLPSEQQKLHSLLNEQQVDAAAALSQAEQVLGMESEFKIAHFDLLIAIKNELTPVQIEQLDTVIQRRLSGRRSYGETSCDAGKCPGSRSILLSARSKKPCFSSDDPLLLIGISIRLIQIRQDAVKDN